MIKPWLLLSWVPPSFLIFMSPEFYVDHMFVTLCSAILLSTSFSLIFLISSANQLIFLVDWPLLPFILSLFLVIFNCFPLSNISHPNLSISFYQFQIISIQQSSQWWTPIGDWWTHISHLLVDISWWTFVGGQIVFICWWTKVGGDLLVALSN